MNIRVAFIGAGQIDQFGNPTPTWYFLQNVNLQIQKLAPTLLKLTSDRVYHFGKPPAGTHGPDDASLLKNAAGEIDTAMRNASGAYERHVVSTVRPPADFNASVFLATSSRSG